MVDNSYSDFTVAGAVRIVQALLSANKAHMIVPALLDHRSAESVEAELAAATSRPQEGTAARAPDTAQASNDALRDAIERRFRSQNGPRTR
jgi:hypothetical protein